ncbi:MAG: hypothetical protein MJK12_03925 [Colwellia sp.]|nr:hypothetical protein [Colwellia sp.]
MRMQSIKLTSKKFISSLLVIGGVIFSMNASAAQPSIESAVTEYVVNQSQQLVQAMAIELKQTIADEINSFSVAESLLWGSEELTQVANEPSNKQESKIKNTETKISTKKSAE